MELSERQMAFVRAIANDNVSGAEAARRAGYSLGSARVTACRLKRNIKIQEAISARRRELGRKYGYDKNVLAEDLLSIINSSDVRAKDIISAVKILGKVFDLYPR